MKKKVLVAMSGGVDSSVAAAILKKQGYELAGIFLKFWAETEGGKNAENRCCSIEAQVVARRVAQKLNIPFYTLNYEKQFKNAVVDYFLSEYESGRTPNPCVMCNKFIKFGILLDEAKKQGADFLATGHYARIESLSLFEAKDKTKDQSYFLWTLTPEQLKHILFPVGDYTKNQVRAMAKKWNLPTAGRRESQEICFINTNLYEFLHKYIQTDKAGPILNKKGQIIGEHEGLVFYTIGQRKNLPALQDQTPESPPRYVIAKDLKKNALIIGEEKDLYSKELIADDVNWLVNPQFNRIQARIRYGHPKVNAKIKIQNSKLKVEFDKPQRAITPGQSIVFYQEEKVLGGGIINLDQ